MSNYPDKITPSPEEVQAIEKRREIIAKLNRENVDSLSAGNGRIGHMIGQNDNQVFILDKPVSIDKPSDDGKHTLRSNHYVLFSENGIREVTFQKGPVNEDGGYSYYGDGSLDSRYSTGENSFRYTLEQHDITADDENGVRPEVYRQLEDSNGKKFDVHYNDGHSGSPGYYYVGLWEDRSGNEHLSLGTYSWDTSHGETGVTYLTGNVNPELVTQALANSREAAKIKTELVKTPVAQEMELYGQLLA